MKCTHCGMPLAPTNTSMQCPRCHSVSGAGPKPITPVAQTPFPQPGQMWQPMATSPGTPSPPLTPASMEAVAPNSGAHFRRATRTKRSAGSIYSAPVPAMWPQPPHMSNVGFIVAGLCIITGALLLVFVYFMALTLPLTGVNTSSAYTSRPVATVYVSPSPTAAVYTPTVVAPTVVGAFPGQQYIDNPQMASLVNINTAQPLQTTTLFRVKQRIYVTFNIYPNGNSGAVCLIWYLNNRSVTQFPFAVTANAKAAYSYVIYAAPGAGYVEIYWASSIACTDKMLAQHVNFTVKK